VASSIKDFCSTSLMTGTTKPFGVSIAMPRLKYFLRHAIYTHCKRTRSCYFGCVSFG
jgi:hypothetical protein